MRETVEIGEWQWGSVCSDCRYIEPQNMSLCPRCGDNRITDHVPVRVVTKSIHHWMRYDDIETYFEAKFGEEIISNELKTK
jgi:hypothetical protein